jgi:hypothetical protein
LKVLPRKLLADSKHRRRFEREARLAAKLHHTNIVSCSLFTGIRARSTPCAGRRMANGWQQRVRMGQRRFGRQRAGGSCLPSRATRGESYRWPGRRTANGWQPAIRMG